MCETITHLGVLVGLGADKLAPVNGTDGFLKAGLQALELAQVGLGRDIPREGVGVPRDGPHDDHTLRVARGDLVEEKVAEKEVAEVVGRHGELITIRRVGGLLGGGLVHGAVGDEGVEGQPAGQKGVDEGADGVLGVG